MPLKTTVVTTLMTSNAPAHHRFNIWELAEHSAGVNQVAESAPPLHSPPLHRDVASPLQDTYDPGLPTAIELFGRFFVSPNGTSSPCKTKTICATAVQIAYRPIETNASLPSNFPQGVTTPKEGADLTLDIDSIGTFRGTVTETNPTGFDVIVARDDQPRVRGNIIQLYAKTKPYQRIELDVPVCTYTTQNGTRQRAKVINISRAEALLRTVTWPPLNSLVIFEGPDRFSSTVSRVFEIGFAVKFTTLIPDDKFSRRLKLTNE